jgi:NADH:ubiquinone oxidoreductase subunit H
MTFALFFLAEYSHIIFMSFLFAVIFLGGWSFFVNYPIILFIKGTLVVFLFVWVRTSFPRLRYDQLMSLLWKSYLPLSLGMIFIVNTILWSINGLPPLSCI